MKQVQFKDKSVLIDLSSIDLNIDSDPDLYAESIIEVKELLQVASKDWLIE